MMRKILCLVLALLLVCVFSACAKAPAAKVDTAALTSALLDSGAFAEPLEPVEAEIGALLYGLEGGEAEEMTFYMPAGPVADELALFKAPDAAGAETLKKLVEARIDYQKRAFADYAPAEVSKLENCVVRVKGPYVLFVAAGDYDAANAVIARYF